MINRKIKSIVEVAIPRFDLKLVRASLDQPIIGMESCLKVLAERQFIPEVVLGIGAATGQWIRLALRIAKD